MFIIQDIIMIVGTTTSIASKANGYTNNERANHAPNWNIDLPTSPNNLRVFIVFLVIICVAHVKAPIIINIDPAKRGAAITPAINIGVANNRKNANFRIAGPIFIQDSIPIAIAIIFSLASLPLVCIASITSAIDPSPLPIADNPFSPRSFHAMASFIVKPANIETLVLASSF